MTYTPPNKPSQPLARVEPAGERRDRSRQALRQKVRDVLAANRAFLDLPNPTNAQMRDHLRALTRQMTALIRLSQDDLLDDTDGT